MCEQEFAYRVTVIIPVYNVEQYIGEALDSLLAQTIPQAEMEVVMVNDGSSDGSEEICSRYAQEHENFVLISQANQGVSAARNNGIRAARGKYLLYLDGDDKLSPGTVKNVADFFDEHYDEVDIVNYPRYFWYKDGRKRLHSRYKFMTKTKVYKLSEIPYVSFTTLNIATKNRGTNNTLFDESLWYHEDIAYLTDVILERNAIGYVHNAEYIYRQHEASTTNMYTNPYYIFELAMGLYEQLFSKYRLEGRIDPYVQIIVLNELGWKSAEDVIFPYHYDSVRFEQAVKRIKTLLKDIDDNLILNHPNIEVYRRFYLLSLKDRSDLHLLTGKNIVALCRGEHVLCSMKSITVVFTRVKIEADYVEWWGFLKSPYFLFSSIPELYIVITSKEERSEQQLCLMPSAHNYYKGKIKTGCFWRFCFRVSSAENVKVSLRMTLHGDPIGITYYFMPELSFKTRAKHQRFSRHGTECAKNGKTFTVKKVEGASQVNKGLERWYWKNNRKFWLVRRLASLNLKRGKRVWLYSDSTGVGKDNGYYQFIHDIRKNDGVERYYVTHDEDFAASDAFAGVDPRHVVIFGSKSHKFLYLQCEKVIAAYIERYNYRPFDDRTYGHYRDISEPEIVYLQHGVLHAHQPHKYSLDRLALDREVVSTSYEIENLIDNYHFMRQYLIPAGMPRFDYIDAETKAEKRILLAPSWRQYLITDMGNGEWGPQEDRFKASDFYKAVQDLLGSRELAALLEKYDYTLELKLHPIFNCYRDCFSFSGPRVRLADKNVNDAEYAVFMTDYSSFVFDFVYLKRPIVYFFPDYEMFRAGLMSYRQLDIPLEEGFGPLALTADEAVAALRRILENGGAPEPVYQKRMDGFFLHYDNSQCDRIYDALTEERTPGLEEGVVLKDLLAPAPEEEICS